MGIQGLMKLISEECPQAIKEQELDNYTGRKIAIDASMAMYQFLIAVRSGPPSGGGSYNHYSMLTNEAGEVTSHIQGMFNRTIKLMSNGIKPVFVFDGKPPVLKGGELAKRLARRQQAEADLAAAAAQDNIEDVERFSKRLVKVTKQHNDDCKELLTLMGVPVVNAPCEAEAQCAELAKNDKVYGTATEDMDALTFQSPKLIRRLTYSNNNAKDNNGQKNSILEIDYEAVLSGMGLTLEQFIDLCILCGCDYCSSIKNVGPKTALKLIRQYGSIEKIIENLSKDSKYGIPEDWYPQIVLKSDLKTGEEKAKDEVKDDVKVEVKDEIKEEPNDVKEETEVKNEEKEDGPESEIKKITQEEYGKCATSSYYYYYFFLFNIFIFIDPAIHEIIPPLYQQARLLFTNSVVTPSDEIDLKWTEPQEDKLLDFLVNRMGFNQERVMNGIKKLKEAHQSKSQKRLDNFFKPLGTITSTTLTNNKRKQAETKANAKNLKKKK